METLKLVTLTGPTCSGKSTIERALVSLGDFGKVVSHTSRECRVGEVNGVDYNFVSKSFFAEHASEFMEVVDFDGNMYGAHSSELERLAALGVRNIVIVAEPTGVGQLQTWASVNGVPCRSFYLHTAPITRYRRFLQRLTTPLDDESMLIQSRRLATMEQESMWLQSWNASLKFQLVLCDGQTPETLAGQIQELL